MPASDIASLRTNDRLRLSADWGRLYLDRPLPWLGVCQSPRQLSSSDRTLIEGWPAYLVYTADRLGQPHGSPSWADSRELGAEALDILQQVANHRKLRFGAFLVIELQLRERTLGGATVRVRSRDLHHRVTEALMTGLEAISRLGDVPEQRMNETVELPEPDDPAASLPEAHWLTLELDPLHYDPTTGQLYPIVSRSLEIVLDAAVRSCCFQFARHHTSLELSSAAAAGRRNLLAVEWSTDRALTRINESYDFLLNVSPVNSLEAWQQFAESGFERAPKLRYRPVNVDPEELRRTLFQIPIHHTEDPTLAQLFRAEQEGIDQKLRMLEQRDTPRFIFDSLHLYGTVGDDLLKNALNLLNTLTDDRPPSRTHSLGAGDLARIARESIRRYREELPELTARIELRGDVESVMVSHGNLLIPETAQYSPGRLQALLAHEVGTHVVTYYNGRAQPLKLLASGLSGADELQEGLAVLAEALTGELTAGRLRLLAARVLAVHRLTQGADFVDLYRELTRVYSFAKRVAFSIALRVFRGGGFTKDAIYLRGLQNVLDYLATGQPLERLLVGKLAFNHIPLIGQLLERNILQPPTLIPHHLRHPDAQERLRDLRQDQRLHGLIRRRSS